MKTVYKYNLISSTASLVTFPEKMPEFEFCLPTSTCRLKKLFQQVVMITKSGFALVLTRIFSIFIPIMS